MNELNFDSPEDAGRKKIPAGADEKKQIASQVGGDTKEKISNGEQEDFIKFVRSPKRHLDTRNEKERIENLLTEEIKKAVESEKAIISFSKLYPEEYKRRYLPKGHEEAKENKGREYSDMDNLIVIKCRFVGEEPRKIKGYEDTNVDPDRNKIILDEEIVDGRKVESVGGMDRTINKIELEDSIEIIYDPVEKRVLRNTFVDPGLEPIKKFILKRLGSNDMAAIAALEELTSNNLEEDEQIEEDRRLAREENDRKKNEEIVSVDIKRSSFSLKGEFSNYDGSGDGYFLLFNFIGLGNKYHHIKFEDPNSFNKFYTDEIEPLLNKNDKGGFKIGSKIKKKIENYNKSFASGKQR